MNLLRVVEWLSLVDVAHGSCSILLFRSYVGFIRGFSLVVVAGGCRSGLSLMVCRSGLSLEVDPLGLHFSLLWGPVVHG